MPKTCPPGRVSTLPVCSLVLERYQSFLLAISFLAPSGVWRPSSGWALCKPSDCASRQVRPSKAHDASAFMSLSSTKLVISSAWMESRLGLGQSAVDRG